MMFESDLNRHVIENVVPDGAHIEDANGECYGPGTGYTYVRETRNTYDDDADRIIGWVTAREELVIEGKTIPGPSKMVFHVKDGSGHDE